MMMNNWEEFDGKIEYDEPIECGSFQWGLSDIICNVCVGFIIEIKNFHISANIHYIYRNNELPGNSCSCKRIILSPEVAEKSYKIIESIENIPSEINKVIREYSIRGA